MKRLPLTVIGGYLGAGKTTLINRLLAEDHGMRVLVMVNDFGAVNIDAGLLRSASEDTIELTNGCVCCTMGADLFMAMGDVLDRRARPDHLVIEASGIADPAKIAEAARAEPEMAYGGVVVVVDAAHFEATAADAQIGAQIRGQVRAADLLVAAKCGAALPPALAMRLAALSGAPMVAAGALDPVAPLLLGGIDPARHKAAGGGAQTGHGAFASWSHEGGDAMDRDTLAARLRAAPAGLYRAKGVIRDADGGGGLAFHKVGPSIEIAAAPRPATSRMVGIGPAAGLRAQEIRDWWLG